MNEPATQTAEVQEAANVASSFSLRFMLGLSLVFAGVFGVAGYFYKSWNLGQQLMFLGVVCAWSLLVGVSVYFALWRRRRMNQELGALRFRAGGPFSTRWGRWSTAAGAMATFAMWVTYVVLHVDMNAEVRQTDAMVLIVAPLNLLFVQVGLLYGLLAQPGALECYKHGLYTRHTGPRAYTDVMNWHWSTVKQNYLIIVIGSSGGAGTTFTIPIPQHARSAVERYLRRCLPAAERASESRQQR